MFPSVPVELHVVVEGVKPWESVYVSGDVPELGSWNPEQALPLVKSPNKENVWSIDIHVAAAQPQLRYRYFICQFLDPYKDASVQRVMVVTKWETPIHPRALNLGGYKTPSFQPDSFGKTGNGGTLINEGWLDKQTEVRVRIQKISFWKSRYRDKPCTIRVIPVDLRYREIDISFDDDEESRDGFEMRTPLIPSHTQCNVSLVNNEGEDYKYKEQHKQGEQFREKDDLTFQVQSIAPEFLAFRVEIYLGSGGSPGGRNSSLSDNMEMVGVCHLLPGETRSCIQTRVISISSLKHQPVGQLTVETFVIQPMPFSYYQGSLEVSYAKYWKKRAILEVGHRGVGVSYSKMNVAKENTIASLTYAGSHGADFVEFDVQLSKDKIPVIFHDFHVCVSVKRRQGSVQDLRALVAKESNMDSEHYELPVKDLRLSQLRLLQLRHPKIMETPKAGKELEVSEDTDACQDDQPFPTLEQVLDRINEHVGFNIEIKSPLKLEDDKEECENFFDRNIYADEILKVIMAHANKRRIVFSSFDPYLCTMLRLKQNKYPVLFLTQGITTRYQNFADKRTISSMNAVAFASSEELLGVNFHSEEILKDTSALLAAKKLGLVAFVWGDDLNLSENRDFCRKAGVDGIVYDRIHDRGGEKANIFLVEKQAKEALFSRSRSSSPNNSPESSIADQSGPPPTVLVTPSDDTTNSNKNDSSH